MVNEMGQQIFLTPKKQGFRFFLEYSTSIKIFQNALRIISVSKCYHFNNNKCDLMYILRGCALMIAFKISFLADPQDFKRNKICAFNLTPLSARRSVRIQFSFYKNYLLVNRLTKSGTQKQPPPKKNKNKKICQEPGLNRLVGLFLMMLPLFNKIL